MDFIKREIMSHDLKIAGNKYPAIFNFRAIAIAEDVSGIANGYTLTRLNEDYDANGNLKRLGDDENSIIVKTGLQANEIVGLACGMMQAAGVKVEVDDLEESISPAELPELIKQIKEIIKYPLNSNMVRFKPLTVRNIYTSVPTLNSNMVRFKPCR